MWTTIRSGMSYLAEVFGVPRPPCPKSSGRIAKDQMFNCFGQHPPQKHDPKHAVHDYNELSGEEATYSKLCPLQRCV